ncbi:hypothetical protein GTY86_16780, partial [Streptomyces sp. SID5770]
MSPEPLPPVAPDVLAEAVEQLSARLRKKLDAAIEGCAEHVVRAADGSLDVRFGEDALVTLRPGPSGAVTEAGQAVCTCLLAPRCLHRAAVLGAAPIADAATETEAMPETVTETEATSETTAGLPEPTGPVDGPAPVTTEAAPAPAPSVDTATPLTPAQVRAATALWEAAAEALSAGVTAGGAVVQAELLRAAHTARLAGLPRAE